MAVVSAAARAICVVAPVVSPATMANWAMRLNALTPNTLLVVSSVTLWS